MSSHDLCVRLVAAGVLCWASFAVPNVTALEIVKDKFSIHAYFRGTGLVGENFNEGKDFSEGSDFQVTLFDDSYFETEMVYRYEKAAAVHFQLALDNGNLFHVTGDPDHVNIVVRDFYVEAFDVLAEGNTLWVGARKYRRLDEHNFFGAGYQLNVWDFGRLGIAQGFRRDFGYWGATRGTTAVELSHSKPLRQMSVLDFEKRITPNSNVIVLTEFQYMGEARGTFSESGSEYTYTFSPVYGYVIGFEINRWGEVWTNSLGVTYSIGDVAGSALSKLNTKGSSEEFLDTTGTVPLTIQYYKQKSHRITGTEVGEYAAPRYSIGYLVGYSYDVLAKAEDKSMLFVQVKPYRHVFKNYHFGAEMSYTWNIKGYGTPSFFVVAPTVRYVTDLGAAGKAVLRAFYAAGVYNGEYLIYSKPSKHVSTWGLQFEARF